MKPKNIPLIYLFGSLFTGVLGVYLRGAPADPDQLFLKSQEIGVFATLVWFSLCTLAWGKLLLASMGLGILALSVDLAMGSAFLAVFGFILGHAGVIDYSYSPQIFLGVQLGPIFLVWWLGRQGYFARGRKAEQELAPDRSVSDRVIEWIGAGCLILVFTSLIFMASLAHGTSDPFMYHLFGPRLWADSGQISIPMSTTIVYQSSWWEMLLLLGQVLLGGPEGKGLIEGHLFGQYLHVAFGLGGCLLVLIYLFRSVPYGRMWIYAAALAGLLTNDLLATAWLAKNDWGVMFWALSGASLLLTPQSETRKELALGGGLLGLAILSKPNAGYFCGSILGAWAIGQVTFSRPGKFRKALLNMSVVGISMLGGMAPILIRNSLATGNPLFPFIMSWTWPSILTPAEVRDMQIHPVLWHFSLRYALNQIHWLVWDSLVHSVLVWIGIFAFLFKDRLCRILAIVAPLSILWMMSAQVFNPFVRWGGVPLVLAGSLGVLAIAEVLSRVPLKNGMRPWVETCVSLGILISLTGYRMVPKFWSLVQGDSPTWVIRNPKIHFGGDSKAWLRMNASWSTPIFSTGDNQLYYISSLPFSAHLNDPVIGREVDQVFSPFVLVKKLRTLGFRYALDTYFWQERYSSASGYLLDSVANEHPEALAYLGSNSQVIDLQVLEESLSGACVSRKQVF